MLKRLKERALPNGIKIVLFLLLSAIVGGFLLALPVSHRSVLEVSIWDHLFTSVSLVSVNSMTTVSFSTSYTLIGKSIAMVLMLIGGVGIMTFFGILAVVTKKPLRYEEKQLISTDLDQFKISNIKHFIQLTLKYVAVMILIGAILLSVRLIPEFGIGQGLFSSLFLAVSAFTNGGFVDFSANGLSRFSDDIYIQALVAALVILGGIGHIVWFDFRVNWPFIKKNFFKVGPRAVYRKMNVYTQMVLHVTFLLIISGMVLVLLTEWNNPATLGNNPIHQKVFSSFFLSVNMRTAGFTTFSFNDISMFSRLLLMSLAIIGGSPGSTSGGIKTTTFALIVLLFINEVKGESNVNYHHRTVTDKKVRQAFVIFWTMILWLYAGIAFLIFFEQQGFGEIFFEAISALSTVGITGDVLNQFSAIGKVIIAVLMFVGRVGPLSIFSQLTENDQDRDKTYASIDIMIG